MWLRGFVGIAAASVVGGCSGAVHQLPSIDQGNLSLAQTEVEKAGGAPARHAVTDEEAQAALRSALDRIRPAAAQLCQDMSVGTCGWRFIMLPDRSLNATARPN